MNGDEGRNWIGIGVAGEALIKLLLLLHKIWIGAFFGSCYPTNLSFRANNIIIIIFTRFFIFGGEDDGSIRGIERD